MTLNEFQALSKRTINPLLTVNDAEIHAVLGMVSEADEYSRILYTPVTCDEEFDDIRAKLIKELGDLMWFVAEYATVRGYTMTECSHEYWNGNTDEYQRNCLSESVAMLASRHQKMYQGKMFSDGERKSVIGSIIERAVAECETLLNVSMSGVLKRNVEKLMKRYPEGFSVERSENRNEDEE